MKSWIDAVQSYFDARTKLWVTIDQNLFDGMYDPAQRPKWVQRAVHQAERKYRAYAAQGKKLVRAHTRVQVTQVNKEDAGSTVRILATEQVCWAYFDKSIAAVECRIIYHRQLWHFDEADWVLVKAEETSDGRSFQEDRTTPANVEEPRLPDDWRKKSAKYDRIRATRYADVWWDGSNPRYPKLSDDCTNFISQCLYAGGIPMTKQGDKVNGWWIDAKASNWSYSWTTSHALFQYVRKSLGGELVQNASELKMGDLIFYDWDGRGRYHHSTIVTDFDDAGDPLVNAHTDASFHRPYTYFDSRAWTSSTRYAFVHIPE